jgi:hypothetical protein
MYAMCRCNYIRVQNDDCAFANIYCRRPAPSANHHRRTRAALANQRARRGTNHYDVAHSWLCCSRWQTRCPCGVDDWTSRRPRCVAVSPSWRCERRTLYTLTHVQGHICQVGDAVAALVKATQSDEIEHNWILAEVVAYNVCS